MVATFKKLIKAVRDGDVVECARLLKLKTADIHKKDNYGNGSIIVASRRGHVNVVETRYLLCIHYQILYQKYNNK